VLVFATALSFKVLDHEFRRDLLSAFLYLELALEGLTLES
jgi:hypothetical protein